MTEGFLVSFGGVIAVVILSLIIEALLQRKARKVAETGLEADEDVSATLARAERTARELATDMARARAHLHAVEK